MILPSSFSCFCRQTGTTTSEELNQRSLSGDCHFVQEFSIFV